MSQAGPQQGRREDTPWQVSFREQDRHKARTGVRPSARQSSFLLRECHSSPSCRTQSKAAWRKKAVCHAPARRQQPWQTAETETRQWFHQQNKRATVRGLLTTGMSTRKRGQTGPSQFETKTHRVLQLNDRQTQLTVTTATNLRTCGYRRHNTYRKCNKHFSIVSLGDERSAFAGARLPDGWFVKGTAYLESAPHLE